MVITLLLSCNYVCECLGKYDDALKQKLKQKKNPRQSIGTGKEEK